MPNFSISFKTYYFAKKSKQEKPFSRVEPMPKLGKVVTLKLFFTIFFTKTVNKER